MRLRLTALLALLLLVATAASAQDADVWLDKMAGLYEKAPFSMDYTMNMNMSQGGQSFSMDGRADMLYGDQAHMKMDMQMNLNMAGAGAMEMKIKAVADGQTMWSEVQNPMMGGTQVIKMSLDAVNDAAGQAGLPGMGGGMDPMAQISALKEMMDWRVIDQSGGRVTLEGSPTEKMLSSLGAEGAALFQGGMRMVLDAETGFPVEASMGPIAQPTMTMRFENLKFLSDAEVPSSSFEYTPPPGANVIDGATMMQR